jgi:hypothetical protein
MKKIDKFKKYEINSLNKLTGGYLSTSYNPQGTGYRCSDRYYVFSSNNNTGRGHYDYSTECTGTAKPNPSA